ncbi:aminotransferase class I/II-fold pyridoxal phosphate-dependent enzyme [Microterricola viridarii]|uniref:aminotransferase class I/II-fold pyridoxal phosphate-dependent enzyme n=1 Tax=Microterricola viridarii TaxID=412690 RepID=UPI002FF5E348
MGLGRRPGTRAPGDRRQRRHRREPAVGAAGGRAGRNHAAGVPAVLRAGRGGLGIRHRGAPAAGRRRLDPQPPALEREFAAGIDAFLLCNPHNPHGVVFDRATLVELARIAAKHDVFVVSDEIHAPLTHPGVTFTPFAPLAAAAGGRAAIVTSASKGWNIAGAKCAIIVAADAATADLLNLLPEEVACRTSILGLHANIVAFRSTDWLDETVERIVANDRLLDELLRAELPAAVYHRPRAGYLAWLDLRGLGLGESPHTRILHEARVALNDGASFGSGGAGFARLNLACSPETLREAVTRIADLVARVAGVAEGGAATTTEAATTEGTGDAAHRAA